MSAEIWVEVTKKPITIHTRPVQPAVRCHFFPAFQYGEETLEEINNKGAKM